MVGISFEAHLGKNQTVPGLAGEALTAELIKKARQLPLETEFLKGSDYVVFLPVKTSDGCWTEWRVNGRTKDGQAKFLMGDLQHSEERKTLQAERSGREGMARTEIS